MPRVFALPTIALLLSLTAQPGLAAFAPGAGCYPSVMPSATGVSAATEVALIKDFAGKMIDVLKRKPETIKCGYIRGRQRPHHACRMA